MPHLQEPALHFGRRSIKISFGLVLLAPEVATRIVVTGLVSQGFATSCFFYRTSSVLTNAYSGKIYLSSSWFKASRALRNASSSALEALVVLEFISSSNLEVLMILEFASSSSFEASRAWG